MATVMRPFTILVAEGDPESSRQAQSALQAAGYMVEVVDNGVDAYRSIRARAPDLLVLAETIPKVRSLEFCRQIKQGGSVKPIPILLLSARKPSEVAADWGRIEELVDLFLIKPFSDEELLIRVRAAEKKYGVRSQDAAPDPQPATAPPVGAGPGSGDVRSTALRYQDELEKKALLIAQQEAAIKQLQGQVEAGRQAGGGDTARLRELEMELATKNLRLAEMEVKLDEILRLKSDFEKRAQDLIEQHLGDERNLRKQFEEILTQRDRLQDELTQMRRHAEDAVVAKERIEESAHSGGQKAEAERQQLQGELVFHRSEAERQMAIADRLGAVVREQGERLAALQETCRLRLEELAAERDRVGQLEARVSTLSAAPQAAADLGRERRAAFESEVAAVSTRMEEAMAQRTEEWSLRIAALEAEKRTLEEQLRGLETRPEAAPVGEGSGENTALRMRLETALGENGTLRQRLEDLEARVAQLATSLGKAESRAIESLQRYQALQQEVEGRESRWRQSAEDARRAREETDRLQGAHTTYVATMEEERLKARDLAVRLDAAERETAELRKVAAESEALSRRRGEELDGLRSQIQAHEVGLAAEKGAKRAVEDELQLQLMNEKEEKEELRARVRELDEKLARGEHPGGDELQRIRESLVETMHVAQEEIMNRTRAESDLAARYDSIKRERDDLLLRLQGETARGQERERHLENLLERALTIAGAEGASQLPARLPGSEPAPWWKASRWLLPLTLLLALVAAGGLTRFYFLSSKGPVAPAPAPPAVPADNPPASVSSPAPSEAQAPTEIAPAAKATWDLWTRSSVSGGVMLQATLRSPEELRASVEAEAASNGWSEAETSRELERRRALFDFATYYYFYVYAKNLDPGYPSYAIDIEKHFFLRDDSGKETAGLAPERIPDGTAIYSHAPSPLAKGRSELIYEVAAWVAFPRRGLASKTSNLQLVVYDIGATSRRVMTWELEPGAR